MVPRVTLPATAVAPQNLRKPLTLLGWYVVQSVLCIYSTDNPVSLLSLEEI